LVISDNLTVARATGKGETTFIFTFSESVGSSFTRGDVTVTGGTPGALIKVNDAKYLLEVTPPANATGRMTVSVAAGAVSDVAGNRSTAAAENGQDFDTVPPAPPSGDVVLASFDEATPLRFEGFDGAETSSIAAGPAGGTGLTAKIVRLGGQVWAGAKVNVGPIALTATNRTISARVFSPTAGTRMVLKLENAADPQGVNSGDLESVQPVVVGWQTLTWVVPEDKVGPQYSWVVMLPNLGTQASANPGETYYFDDIKLVVPPVPSDVLLASFDEPTPLTFSGFDGAETSSIAAGPAGGTGLSAKIVRLGGQVWAGAKVNVGPIALTATNRTISARVFSPTAGTKIVLKLENAADPQNVNSGDLEAVASVVGWQTLTWVVPAEKVGPEYVWVVMLPNLGITASTNPGETYYFDDIKLLVPPVPAATVLATFDEPSPLAFSGFDGAETSSIAAGPAGGTGLSAKIVRLGGQVWAGAKVNVGPIALTSTKRTITARVHSPTAGTKIVLKLENAADPQNVNSGDLEAVASVVGWQTLTWVVPTNKVGPEYVWVVMLPNLGLTASTNPGETYHFDDIKLLPGQ
jgi:hypothetical protein